MVALRVPVILQHQPQQVQDQAPLRVVVEAVVVQVLLLPLLLLVLLVVTRTLTPSVVAVLLEPTHPVQQVLLEPLVLLLQVVKVVAEVVLPLLSTPQAVPVVLAVAVVGVAVAVGRVTELASVVRVELAAWVMPL